MPTDVFFAEVCFFDFRHKVTVQQCRFLYTWNNNIGYITYLNSLYCQWTAIIFLFFKIKCFSVTLNLTRTAFNVFFSPENYPPFLEYPSTRNFSKWVIFLAISMLNWNKCVHSRTAVISCWCHWIIQMYCPC